MMVPPTGAIPPALPPSVEEAYRKKCIQLKQRLNEVEESNEAARQRIARSTRSVQKLRLERAFLLEQIAKRTSTNVEDSDGSPSPPSTPKEKPLRTKRGHRKPDFLTTEMQLEGRHGNTFIQQGPIAHSPSSDAFSHTHHDSLRNSTPQAQAPKRQLPSNGALSANILTHPRRPKNAFDLYCNETRPILTKEHEADASFDIEATLARGWSTLDSDKKAEFTQGYEQLKKAAELEKAEVEKEVNAGAQQTVFDGTRGAEGDEDIEMADDVITPVPAPVEVASGFTAVNRS